MLWLLLFESAIHVKCANKWVPPFWDQCSRQGLSIWGIVLVIGLFTMIGQGGFKNGKGAPKKTKQGLVVENGQQRSPTREIPLRAQALSLWTQAVKLQESFNF